MHTNALKWGIITGLALLSLYLVTIIYLAGQTLLAAACLSGFALAFYVYTARSAYTYRYLFPGLAGMGIFVVFPLLYTIAVGFTNYSSTNLISFARVTQYFLDETYQSEGAARFSFALYPEDGQFRLLLENKAASERFITPPLTLDATQPSDVNAEPLAGEPAGTPLALKDIVPLRQALTNLTVYFPDGSEARMAGLREFSAQRPLYVKNPDGSLTNQKTGEALKPNFTTGFYETSTGAAVPPGFPVNVGFSNFMRVLAQPEFQEPFLRIFIWTVVFAGLTVLFTLIVGMTLASLLNWEALRFRGVYRTLLFLPYAVPGFISILVFRGLFNNNFGEINGILDALFGIKPNWFSDPLLAKTMILIVNTWLGYPYIMVLCMGLLKSIPADLYEASAIDGISPWQNFTKITAPLIVKPLTPLLIASFTFNFNNFVLISLLTGGRPDFLGTRVPAGTTDILVTYTYRVAFEDAGKNFGLAAAIATIIFLMVAVMALFQLRMTKINAAR